MLVDIAVVPWTAHLGAKQRQKDRRQGARGMSFGSGRETARSVLGGACQG